MILTHIYRMDMSILISWMSPFRIFGVSGVLYQFYLTLANSVDPDQTPRSVLSDLGLHCLLRSKKGTHG